MDFLVYGTVSPLSREKEKERKEEWRKKGDRDKPLNNHWCKRQRTLTFGLKGLGFNKKNKVYFGVLGLKETRVHWQG